MPYKFSFRLARKGIEEALHRKGFGEDADKVVEAISEILGDHLPCTRCGAFLPDTAFYRSTQPRRRDRQSLCKACFKERSSPLPSPIQKEPETSDLDSWLEEE